MIFHAGESPEKADEDDVEKAHESEQNADVNMHEIKSPFFVREWEPSPS